MLRMARTSHRETGLDESLPRRRRRAQLRRQRPAPARGPVQATLDPACRRRCRRRARRRAARSGTATAASPARVTPGTRRDEGRVSRARRSRRRRDRDVPAVGRARPIEQARARRAAADASRELLADEKVVGWFKGRMEFGPRALGARSILGDPRSPRMQAQMNLKIKFREGFRPFAPSVLREHVSDYFELDMRLAVHAARRAGEDGAADPDDARAADSSAASRSSTCRAPTSRRSRTSTTRRASRR